MSFHKRLSNKFSKKASSSVVPNDAPLMLKSDSPRAQLHHIPSHEKAGLNDASDIITPQAAYAWNQSFPDKERSTGIPSGASIGLFDSSNGRTSQRGRSFKSNSQNNSRNNSFTSLKGPTSSLNVLSRQTSETSPSNSDRNSSSSKQRGKAPLKIFVRAPSSASSGESPRPISMDSVDFLTKVAEKAAQEACGYGDEENQRPPSPRPHDENSTLREHSEVLEQWEDAARFRQHDQVGCSQWGDMAGPKYKRSGSRTNSMSRLWSK